MKHFSLSIVCALVLAVTVPAHAGLFSGSGSDYTRTQYPVVLVNGLFGFDTLVGLDYFYRIPQALTRSGADVHVAPVAAAESSEVRGEQLAQQVRQILAMTGAEKVNLVGHSHGGPTIRYVASVYPQLVASATSVGGVNQGSDVADIIAGVQQQSGLAEALVTSLGNALANLIDLLSGGGYDQDIQASLASLTSAGLDDFNARYPEGIPQTPCGSGTRFADNGVQYFSWSGTQPLTNVLDASDALLAVTSLAFQGEPNDGLVSACSSHLGLVIRDDYRMNHLDEVNQIAGLYNIFETKPTAIYRQQANRLKNAGL